LESVHARRSLARCVQREVAMPTNPATASDVNELLGEVDPLILERILATGATPEEIGEALLVVEQEHGFGEEPHEPSSPRVTEVRALLNQFSVLEREVEPEEDMM
jgi:hypothetical protein